MRYPSFTNNKKKSNEKITNLAKSRAKRANAKYSSNENQKKNKNKTHTQNKNMKIEEAKSKQIRLAKAEEKHYLQKPVTSPQHKPRQQTSTRKKSKRR